MSIVDYQEKKEKLRILILGPYKPQVALSRLENFKRSLVMNGFKLAKLAKDFEDEPLHSQDFDEHYTLKSRAIISTWSHTCIFVFFMDADNSGVGGEITFTCDELPNKQSSCAVFFEGELENYSSQIKGPIKLTKRISYMTFRDDLELHRFGVGHCTKMLDRMFHYL